MQEQIVRKDRLREMTGMSPSQTERMEKAGKFPRRRQITERIVGWSYIEVQQWINERLHGDKLEDMTSK